MKIVLVVDADFSTSEYLKNLVLQTTKDRGIAAFKANSIAQASHDMRAADAVLVGPNVPSSGVDPDGSRGWLAIYAAAVGSHKIPLVLICNEAKQLKFAKDMGIDAFPRFTEQEAIACLLSKMQTEMAGRGLRCTNLK